MIGAPLAVALAAKSGCAISLGVARGRALRPALALLAGGVVADLARLAIGTMVLAPARSSGLVPYAGWTRAAFHADQALLLAWPFGVAAVAWWSWRRELIGQPLAWGACTALLALSYPHLRGESLGRCYALVSLGCALWALLAVALRTERAGRAQLVSLVLIAGECATLAGPYVSRPFETWPIAQVTWTAAFAAAGVAAWWGRAWTRRA